MTDILLLHGAWHQPAHFDDLAARLRDAGSTVHVPDLGGLDLASGTQLTQKIVDGSTDATVVVAHSFGGVTAGGLTGVATVVFLAGWVLDVGETPEQLLGEAALVSESPTPALAMRVEDDGRLSLDGEDARVGLFADCAEDVKARAVRLLRPEPPAIFSARPQFAAWRNTPTVYVDGSEDRAIPAPLRALFAGRCSRAESWPTSHSPHLSRPDDVAELVLGTL